MSNTESAVESRALVLLGQGIDPSRVASAVGVTVSRISQLISDPIFADKVAQLRFETLSGHNNRDARYDGLEDSLIERLEGLLPMMYKPMEILKAVSVINMAKRRGSAAPDNILAQRETVSLVMPSVVINQHRVTQNLQVNIHNQVIKAGDQELVTVQSSRMSGLLASNVAQKAIESLSQKEKYNEQSHSRSTEAIAGASG